MTGLRPTAFIFALALALAPVGGAKAAPCRLALALALDISFSVKDDEYAFQKHGLAQALRDGEVRSAILGQSGEVHAAAYEWSGYARQTMIAGWTALTSPAAINRFAARIDAHRRIDAALPTAVGRALRFGGMLLRRAPPGCARRVIDISGDGESNLGPDADAPELRRLLAGITVNALVIKGEQPDPEPYFRDRVIWGPGAFMMVARGGFDDYPEMILGKLLREIGSPLILGALE